jgi:hypothetical protein
MGHQPDSYGGLCFSSGGGTLSQTAWEYCLVSHVPSGPVIVNVVYYTPDGARTEKHHAQSYDEGVNKLWPSIIANLGREGWELVTVDTGALYFKRAVSDSSE